MSLNENPLPVKGPQSLVRRHFLWRNPVALVLKDDDRPKKDKNSESNKGAPQDDLSKAALEQISSRGAESAIQAVAPPIHQQLEEMQKAAGLQLVPSAAEALATLRSDTELAKHLPSLDIQIPKSFAPIARGLLANAFPDIKLPDLNSKEGNAGSQAQQLQDISDRFLDALKEQKETLDATKAENSKLREENERLQSEIAQLKHEAVARTGAIRRLKDSRRGNSDLSIEQLSVIVDRNRFRTTGQPNLSAIGRELGCHHDTAKRLLKANGLLR